MSRYRCGEPFRNLWEFLLTIEQGYTVWDTNASRPQNAAFLVGWPFQVLRGAWPRFRRAVER